ncbi:MAG: hypothetical protein Q7S60_04365 [bacterium]|nr:hypothetical protein [bacterium]
MSSDSNAKDGKIKRAFGWLLWWQVDKKELREQVEGYKTLKITKSAKGISLLFLLFSAIATTAFILFFNWDSWAYLDVFLFLLLGLFIYRGQKWAMVAAMIFWTFEKVFLLFDSTISFNPILSFIWWAVYMRAFYLAFQVERLRSRGA